MTKQNRVYKSVLDLIATTENPTPMVKISEKVNPNKDFSIYLKLERYNPFGSIKDRIALSMLEGVEVKEGQALVEPSSGNTGIALVALANAKGIPIEIAVPERIPEEKKIIPIIPERRSKRFGGRNAEKQGRGKIYKSKSI
ncbi:MAG: pyridoxal-phosphate dependent enzyme [Planctomycetota bacterium]|jgi:cysteine synthase